MPAVRMPQGEPASRDPKRSIGRFPGGGGGGVRYKLREELYFTNDNGQFKSLWVLAGAAFAFSHGRTKACCLLPSFLPPPPPPYLRSSGRPQRPQNTKYRLRAERKEGEKERREVGGGGSFSLSPLMTLVSSPLRV